MHAMAVASGHVHMLRGPVRAELCMSADNVCEALQTTEPSRAAVHIDRC